MLFCAVSPKYPVLGICFTQSPAFNQLKTTTRRPQPSGYQRWRVNRKHLNKLNCPAHHYKWHTKTCECFLRETHIFILTTQFKLLSGASKTAPSPAATFSLCLIFLGFPAVFQLFGHSSIFEILFVLNWCTDFPLTSFSSTFQSHDSVFHMLFFSLDSSLKGPTLTID